VLFIIRAELKFLCVDDAVLAIVLEIRKQIVCYAGAVFVGDDLDVDGLAGQGGRRLPLVVPLGDINRPPRDDVFVVLLVVSELPLVKRRHRVELLVSGRLHIAVPVVHAHEAKHGDCQVDCQAVFALPGNGDVLDSRPLLRCVIVVDDASDAQRDHLILRHQPRVARLSVPAVGRNLAERKKTLDCHVKARGGLLPEDARSIVFMTLPSLSSPSTSQADFHFCFSLLSPMA
ncbi:hypothetical protein B0T26DRAFT_783146, partial [Lasiosphaeria miniovina]